nr:MAG TPA: hypothetical protein [Caudoviricetes sp.]
MFSPQGVILHRTTFPYLVTTLYNRFDSLSSCHFAQKYGVILIQMGELVRGGYF